MIKFFNTNFDITYRERKIKCLGPVSLKSDPFLYNSDPQS